MKLPAKDAMLTALMENDSTFEGVFYFAVKTTGIFCRPTCTARKPRPKNVEFFPSVRDCLSAGFRPCKRCRPMEPAGAPPEWLRPLLETVEAHPTERISDSDLSAMGLDLTRVRRWFRAQHGMTFQAYHRSRRLGLALGHLNRGEDMNQAAYSTGFESPSGFREAFGRWFGDAPGRLRNQPPLVVERFLTQLGPMLAAATDEGLALLEFSDRRMLETQIRRLRGHLGCRFVMGRNAILRQAERELDEYFRGVRKTFEVPLLMPGTPFQRAAWEALVRIPYGATRTYDMQARAIGHVGAQRAVGRANGDNRIAVVVPCHRVIRSDGTLSGYGGGVWRKRWLLDHEQRFFRNVDRLPTPS